MAKLRQKVIRVEPDIEVGVSGSLVTAKGPKGERSLRLPGNLGLNFEGGEIRLKLISGGLDQLGLFVSLVKNLLIGVSRGYQKELEIIGVGYKVKKEGRGLILQIGFSHPLHYTPPPGCEVAVWPDNRLVVSSADKQLTGQVAAEIRSLKPPEPYKGKGIRYLQEVVRRKPGKAGRVGLTVK